MSKRLTTEEFIKRATLVHNNKYDYSKVKYINNHTKICIICPKHGEFWQSPSKHLIGQQCPMCKDDNLRYYNNKVKSDCSDYFIEKAQIIHGKEYDYSQVNYVNSKTNVCIICKKHGEFYTTPNAHLSGHKCPKCSLENKNKSLSDDRYKFIWKAVQKHGYKYDYSKVSYVRSKNDVEIICREHGSFWQRPNNHLGGSICPTCAKENIGLISKYESEIYDFIADNYTNTIIRNDRNVIKPNELVSLMTFGKLRKNVNNKYKEHCFEMIRFVNKCNHNIIGGASKLLKHFIKTINPKEIISYSDNRWGDGNLYLKLDFKFIRNSGINYFYVIGDKKYNRFNFRKDVLVKQGFDKNKSEHEIMLDRHIYRIYDCGCKVFLYKNQ